MSKSRNILIFVRTYQFDTYIHIGRDVNGSRRIGCCRVQFSKIIQHTARLRYRTISHDLRFQNSWLSMNIPLRAGGDLVESFETHGLTYRQRETFLAAFFAATEDRYRCSWGLEAAAPRPGAVGS